MLCICIQMQNMFYFSELQAEELEANDKHTRLLKRKSAPSPTTERRHEKRKHKTKESFGGHSDEAHSPPRSKSMCTMTYFTFSANIIGMLIYRFQ